MSVNWGKFLARSQISFRFTRAFITFQRSAAFSETETFTSPTPHSDANHENSPMKSGKQYTTQNTNELRLMLERFFFLLVSERRSEIYRQIIRISSQREAKVNETIIFLSRTCQYVRCKVEQEVVVMRKSQSDAVWPSCDLFSDSNYLNEKKETSDRRLWN